VKGKLHDQFTPTTPTRLNSTAELSRVDVVGVNWPLDQSVYCFFDTADSRSEEGNSRCRNVNKTVKSRLCFDKFLRINYWP